MQLRYFALLTRARAFAAAAGHPIVWTLAQDIPLFRDDRDLAEKNPEALQNKRIGWLKRHDQDTQHLSSILPLVPGMPVRLTESIDRPHRLYRGRRGIIFGWLPHKEESQTLVDGEIILSHLPEIIYVQFVGAKFCFGKGLPDDVYPITAMSRTWKVNKFTGVAARRTG